MKPIQYLKGWVEFYKLKFKVTPDVLIPRPETELLVDEVLNSIKYYVSSIKGKDILILDIGTGTGNIAISIAKNTQEVRILATDISKSSLKVAIQNARLHGIEDRIKFIHSDLLKNPIIHNIPLANEFAAGITIRTSIPLSTTLSVNRMGRKLILEGNIRKMSNDWYTRYTILIIVTNLPYIPSARIPYLDSSVIDFEPLIALDGGYDGFELYRKLFQQIKDLRLHTRGVKLIVGEIDYTHGELAVNEAQKFFPKAQVEVKTDLAKKQRILKIAY